MSQILPKFIYFIFTIINIHLLIQTQYLSQNIQILSKPTKKSRDRTKCSFVLTSQQTKGATNNSGKFFYDTCPTFFIPTYFWDRMGVSHLGVQKTSFFSCLILLHTFFFLLFLLMKYHVCMKKEKEKKARLNYTLQFTSFNFGQCNFSFLSLEIVILVF